MSELEKYRQELGRHMMRYVDGEIGLTQLQEEVPESISEDALDDEVPLIWHIIYQHETDISVDDPEYEKRVQGRFRKIAEGLISHDPDLRIQIDAYFNKP